MKAAFLTLLLLASPAFALNEGLQCVPYARALSGVTIYGDAHSWWGQAEGKYARGNTPEVGAVLAFPPHGNMRLGHVAAVRRIVDDRTIVISHANWSTIGGVRGHIEEDVRAVDVSEANDWSRVRVWYTPNEALGSTEWPVHGFIYPKQRRSDSEARKAVALLLKDRVIPALPAATPVRLAEATKPVIKSALVKTGFGLSGDLLKDIDRKAAKETQASPTPTKPVRLASVEKLIARLPKS
ncbi:CHAP domain-containing protein [Sphingorhabdus sp. IMCC26285]|uniref:CHAP domain-containing protein n=1 Tax=Sphingorhabdus profundilacus TaxID=2509718 RepID=A0A6I4M371_9SPHN|nr:CHAP domain-containing protein [Sphingorhabdus profundilacus]